MSADFHKKLNEQLVTTVGQYMQSQMKAMFICANEIISSLPGSCGISEKACEGAFRSLKLSKENIVSNYTHHINQQLKPISDDEFAGSSSDDCNEFVKQDEVDVMVAMTAIYSKALSESENTVHQLETRLEYLEIAAEDSFEKQAVSPKRLCETFYKALGSSGVNDSHSLVLLQLYDQTINSNLSV